MTEHRASVGPRDVARARHARAAGRACCSRSAGRCSPCVVVVPALWVLFFAPTTGKWATSFGSAVHDPKDFLITVLNGVTAAGALLRRRERLHAHLRPDARRQHGARRVLPVRRLRRAQAAAPHGRRGRLVRADELAGQPDALDRAGDRRRRSSSPRMGLVDAAALPALEPGPGPAPGADHDRDLDHPRRPDARALRRRRRGHRLAAELRHVREPPRRGDPVHRDAPRHPRRSRSRSASCSGSG